MVEGFVFDVEMNGSALGDFQPTQPNSAVGKYLTFQEGGSFKPAIFRESPNGHFILSLKLMQKSVE